MPLPLASAPAAEARRDDAARPQCKRPLGLLLNLYEFPYGDGLCAKPSGVTGTLMAKTVSFVHTGVHRACLQRCASSCRRRRARHICRHGQVSKLDQKSSSKLDQKSTSAFLCKSDLLIGGRNKKAQMPSYRRGEEGFKYRFISAKSGEKCTAGRSSCRGKCLATNLMVASWSLVSSGTYKESTEESQREGRIVLESTLFLIPASTACPSKTPSNPLKCILQAITNRRSTSMMQLPAHGRRIPWDCSPRLST